MRESIDNVTSSPAYQMGVNALTRDLVNLRRVFHSADAGNHFVELVETHCSSLYRWDAEEKGFVFCGDRS